MSVFLDALEQQKVDPPSMSWHTPGDLARYLNAGTKQAPTSTLARRGGSRPTGGAAQAAQ